MRAFVSHISHLDGFTARCNLREIGIPRISVIIVYIADLIIIQRGI